MKEIKKVFDEFEKNNVDWIIPPNFSEWDGYLELKQKIQKIVEEQEKDIDKWKRWAKMSDIEIDRERLRLKK